MAYKIRVHRWVNGRLETSDVYQRTRKEALALVSNMHYDSVKVFDHQGVVIHAVTGKATELYA